VKPPMAKSSTQPRRRVRHHDHAASNVAVRPVPSEHRVGKEIALLTNHFPFQMLKQRIYQFSVEFTVRTFFRSCPSAPLCRCHPQMNTASFLIKFSLFFDFE
jgi:hypothetical protein